MVHILLANIRFVKTQEIRVEFRAFSLSLFVKLWKHKIMALQTAHIHVHQYTIQI